MELSKKISLADFIVRDMDNHYSPFLHFTNNASLEIYWLEKQKGKPLYQKVGVAGLLEEAKSISKNNQLFIVGGKRLTNQYSN